MNVIGFSGGPDGPGFKPVAPDLSALFFHDAAAALVIDGELEFAVEEERLNRQKHTNVFPSLAIRACLDHAGLEPCQIDHFAFFFDEQFYNTSLREACERLGRPAPDASVRALLADRLSACLRFQCDPARLRFADHHRAHARSAFAGSGYEEALVLVIDGNGERDSVTLFRADQDSLVHLIGHPASQSVGHFYRAATNLAGFRDFDEYKFMGLAPYGDPQRLRPEIDALVRMAAGGAYTIDVEGLEPLARALGLGEAAAPQPDGVAADFAAAVQRAVERLAEHVVRPWAERTGLRALCLAGGVAQNCVMNTRLAECGLFDRVFAYPGAYDAGAAIGAALEVGGAADSRIRTGARFCPFLGPATRSRETVLDACRSWAPLLEWEEAADPAVAAAAALANGAIVGWLSGRSEFGPRALGGRSILADARPARNWPRINLAVKQRESFRPFAPACLEEFAETYFEVPRTAETLGHMTFIARVRDRYAHALGAVTHVDGSARLQTVSADWNADFHRLVCAFHDMTGCPVVLNTSFNNSAEPIVQTPADAVRTFLLTALDRLYVEGWVVTKRADPFLHFANMEARLNDWAQAEAAGGGAEGAITVWRRPHYRAAAPRELASVVSRGEAVPTWRPLGPIIARSDAPEALNAALIDLWRKALIDVRHA